MPDANVHTRDEAGRFGGRTALVTGAAGGIGSAIARQLAQEGARVMLADLDLGALERAVSSFDAPRDNLAIGIADLANRAERDRLVPDMLDRWGRIDILVNNAADHGSRIAFVDALDEEWEHVFAVNLQAVAGLGRSAARDMRTRRSGSIINVTSVQVCLPVPSYAAYVASKGAVSSLTRAMASELSPFGIRVNVVAPGVIATPAFAKALGVAVQNEDHDPKARTAALLGREGRPEEVAMAVAFLASDQASFITGVSLSVDGGRSISRKADPFELAFGDQTGAESY